MILTREGIQRMIDGVGNGAAGGGGGDISALLAGYATESWVDENYLSIEFFSKLFKAYNSANPAVEIKPNDTQSTITNIKAMFGFWTEQYLSALGQNAGGGGGGSDTLADLLDVELTTPTDNQVLTYYNGKWRNMNAAGVDMSTVWNALGDNTTTQQIAASHLTTALGDYVTWTELGDNTQNQQIAYNHLTTALGGYGSEENRLNIYTYGRISLFESLNFTRENWNYITVPATNGSLAFNVGSPGTAQTKMCLLNNGNVGIGTIEPSYKLSVNGDVSATNFRGALIGNATTATTAGALSVVSKTAWGQTYWTSGGVPDSISGNMSNVGDISFSASGKNIGGFLYFDTTHARIGVGISSPSHELTVKNTIKIQSADGTVSTSIGLWDGLNNRIETVGRPFILTVYGEYGIGIGHNGSVNDIYITSAGLVGIGKSNPRYKLEVNGYVGLNEQLHFTRENWNYISVPATNGNLAFNIGTPGIVVPSMCIINNGNVGIGTTTPSQKLDVNGNICAASSDGTFIQIGGIKLVYDLTNNALKVVQSDGTTAANFYATGGVSALGYGVSGGGGAGDVTWDALRDNTDERPIALSHISTALQGYLPTVLSGYLPLTGGVLTGELTGYNYIKVQKTISNVNRVINIGQWDNTNNRIEVVGADLLITIYGNGLKIGRDGYGDDLQINSSGNLTFGTSARRSTIYTYGAISLYEKLYFTRQSWNYITVPSTDGVLAFNVGAAGTAYTKMCMLNNGNVGIGTTTPSYTLDVNGTLNASGNTSIGGTLSVTGAASFTSSATAASFIKTNGTSSQFLKADGSVDSTSYATASSVTTLQNYFTNGIANEAAKLSTVSKTAWGRTYWTSGGVPDSISGNIENAGNITPSATATYNIGSSALLWNYVYAKYGYYSDNVKVAKLLSVNCDPFSSGSYKITVEGAILVGNIGTATLGIGSWDGANNRFENGGRPLLITSYSQPIKIGLNGNGSSIYINTNDYVGIGTTNPQYKLHVDGIVGLFESLNFMRQSWNYITVPSSSGNLSFNIGTPGTANTKMCIINNGNVGIGTTSPSYKLHVVGDVYASDAAHSQSIELNESGGLVNYGGFIDFHYNGTSSYSDYSLRLVESTANVLSIQAKNTSDSSVRAGLEVGKGYDYSYIDIGGARIVYRADQNALRITDPNGGTMNLYATGGVSALGMNTIATDGTVSANLLPSATETYNIGSTSYLWKYVYANRFYSYYNSSKYGYFYQGTGGVSIGTSYGFLFLSSDTDIIIETGAGIVIGNDVREYTSYTVEIHGNTYFTGSISAYSVTQRSDMRWKDVVSDFILNTESIANAPLFKYTFKDGDKRIMVGTSAQYWNVVMPQTVFTDADGMMSLDYGVTALAGVISVAREVSEHERRIAKLEAENATLRAEIEDLKAA